MNKKLTTMVGRSGKKPEEESISTVVLFRKLPTTRFFRVVASGDLTWANNLFLKLTQQTCGIVGDISDSEVSHSILTKKIELQASSFSLLFIFISSFQQLYHGLIETFV